MPSVKDMDFDFDPAYAVDLLQESHRALRAWCHDSECQDIFNCPATHTDRGCSARLGFDTAIAWEMAKAVNDLLILYAQGFGLSDRLNNTWWRVYSLESAFSYHDNESESHRKIHGEMVQIRDLIQKWENYYLTKEK